MIQARTGAPLAAVAVLFSACHVVSESIPERPTPVAAPVVPLPILPAPSPVAPPPAGPTPAPAPNPTPVPGSGVTIFCSPAIPPDGYPCPLTSSCEFVSQVEAAISAYQNSHPEVFNGVYVLDKNAYYTGVFKNLYGAGYCAVPDSGEVAVSTRDNINYRENYEIITSTGKIRNGGSFCISYCNIK